VLLAGVAVGAPARGDDDAMGRRVQQLLSAHRAEVYGCVQAAPGAPRGELLVRIVVGEAHKVERAEVLKDESGGGPVGACIVAKVRGWDLASLGAAPGDQIVFPLAFAPGDGASIERRRDARVLKNQALFVLRPPVSVSGQPLAAGDVAWAAPKPGMRVEVGEGGEYLLIDAHLPEQKGAARSWVKRLAEQKRWPILGGKGAAVLYLDGTAAPMAVDRLEAAAGAQIPPHRHDGAIELVYVLEGRGATTLQGKRMEVRGGDVLAFPAGAEHALIVEEKLSAVQVYAPGGPEQRFKGSK
jgi:quercetin dioxygenase-like cupin family protein